MATTASADRRSRGEAAETEHPTFLARPPRAPQAPNLHSRPVALRPPARGNRGHREARQAEGRDDRDSYGRYGVPNGIRASLPAELLNSVLDRVDCQLTCRID